MSEDNNQLATKRDIHKAVSELEKQTNIKFDAVLQTIKDEGKKTRDHFDVVAKNIHKDVAGANKIR